MALVLIRVRQRHTESPVLDRPVPPSEATQRASAITAPPPWIPAAKSRVVRFLSAQLRWTLYRFFLTVLFLLFPRVITHEIVHTLKAVCGQLVFELWDVICDAASNLNTAVTTGVHNVELQALQHTGSSIVGSLFLLGVLLAFRDTP